MPGEDNLGGLGLSIPRPEWQGRQNLAASLRLGFPLGKMTRQAGLPETRSKPFWCDSRLILGGETSYRLPLPRKSNSKAPHQGSEVLGF